MNAKKNHPLPNSVWVVFNSWGPDFVTGTRQEAMDHASEAAGNDPDYSPWQVREYVAAQEGRSSRSTRTRTITGASLMVE